MALTKTRKQPAAPEVKAAPAPKAVANPLKAKDVVKPRRDLPMARFLREIRSELKKVVWPTREEATNLTLVVSAVSAVVGGFLYLTDLFFKEVFRLLLGGA